MYETKLTKEVVCNYPRNIKNSVKTRKWRGETRKEKIWISRYNANESVTCKKTPIWYYDRGYRTKCRCANELGIKQHIQSDHSDDPKPTLVQHWKLWGGQKPDSAKGHRVRPLFSLFLMQSKFVQICTPFRKLWMAKRMRKTSTEKNCTRWKWLWRLLCRNLRRTRHHIHRHMNMRTHSYYILCLCLWIFSHELDGITYF